MKESTALLKARPASLENILFNVEQHELTDDREILTDCHFGGQYASAIYCPSMNKVLHLAGSSYLLVSNETLLSPIITRLDTAFGQSGYEVKCWNEDDRRFSIQFVLVDKVLEVTNKDYLNAMIEVQNSYDGTLRHSVSLSFFRQVCSNGLMAYRKEAQVRQKHNNDPLPNLDVILNRLDSLDSNLHEFRKLSERRITAKEVEEVIKVVREQKNDAFPKRLIEEVPLKLYEEAEALESQPSAWLLYNSFNGILNHDQRIGLAMDVKERIDRSVLDAIRTGLSIN
jgi:hypothetical protein